MPPPAVRWKGNWSEVIFQRIEQIRSRIRQAALRVGRDPSQVQLIAVTKDVPIEIIREAISLGVRHIGENRVQEALVKRRDLERSKEMRSSLSPSLQWHLIGHLQTNKVRDAVEIFDWIHSVDSLRLAEKIAQESQRRGKVMPIMIEVNVSGEATKYGVKPDELEPLIEQIKKIPDLKLEGLMTMAPFVSDPEKARPYFREFAKLRNRGQPPILKHLSMGMSQDFEVAVEEGATWVRVGTAIFG